MKELFVLYGLGGLSFGINSYFQLNNTCYMQMCFSWGRTSQVHPAEQGEMGWGSRGRQWAPTQRYRSVSQLRSRK